MGILVDELTQLYQAFAQGQPSPLEPLPIQYSDYVYWRQRHLDGQQRSRLLDYWREHLRDAPTGAAHRLPASTASAFPRRADQRGPGCRDVPGPACAMRG